MSYVITCGDEGVQLNEGTRLGVVGAGFRVGGFSEVVKACKVLFGKQIAIASSDENSWIKKVLNLNDWEQVNASMQQYIEALADREKLGYAGHIGFTDPKVLQFGVKGHIVRPHDIHIANKICFTLGGGEQKYNLGCYVISADWVAEVGLRVAKPIIQSQIAFYQSQSKVPLKYVFEMGGALGEKTANQNKKILEKMGVAETSVIA
jgi:hypothetical protein